MAFDFLEKLKSATEKYKLEGEETISKADAVEGLSEELGIDIPEPVQELMPDEIILKTLEIDRTTEPDAFFWIVMQVAEPPIFKSFPNILKPEYTLLEVKTNQPKETGDGVKTEWSVAVTAQILGNGLTIKIDHSNPKRFELKEDFSIDDERLTAAFGIPKTLFDIIPGNKKITIKKLIVDDSEEESYVELEATMDVDTLFHKTIDQFITTKPKNARFYFKKTPQAV